MRVRKKEPDGNAAKRVKQSLLQTGPLRRRTVILDEVAVGTGTRQGGVGDHPDFRVASDEAEEARYQSSGTLICHM